MLSVIAHSEAIDTPTVIAELLSTSREKLGGQVPRAGILFASVDYEHGEILRALKAEWPALALVGGSSDGELSSELGFRDDSVLLTLFAGDDFEVHCGVGRDLSADIDRAVDQALAGYDGETPALCITVFAPSTNASEVIRSLDRRLDGPCPILGGLSGDHREYTAYREFHGEEVNTDSLAVLLLEGDFRFSWGVGSGWFPLGIDHEITRSEGHMVHEIDGRPAVEIYENHYGSLPKGSLGEYPMAVYDSESEDWSLRAILDSDEETGAMRFAGEVLQGARVRLTEVLPEGILSGSESSLLQALSAFAGPEPELALVFTCAARKWVLGSEAKQEIERLVACAEQHGVPDLQIAGLYVYGEISPPNGGSQNTFHNETCVSLVLGK